jgi:hypothetical protein
MDKDEKIHLVAIDMGYGHQRAAYPLIDISNEGIININDYEGIDPKEKKSWHNSRKWYEIISYFKKVPLLGSLVFNIMDYFQRIAPFYPKRDLSKPSEQQRFFYKKVKTGTGRKLITQLNHNPLPFVATFFVPTYFAEHYNYKGDIYCIVCDADISRAWAPLKPKTSKVRYLAPNKRVKERLKLYGVRDKNIYISGFPLPKENIGGRNKNILKNDLRKRLCMLDPKGVYRDKYSKLITDYLGPIENIKKPERPLTITFAVGGAGAQREMGVNIAKNLKDKISNNEIILNLVAGVRDDVYQCFSKALKKIGLLDSKNVNIIFNKEKIKYFSLFNKALRNTDILWTKPSELTFYSGLGIPILMSNPIGSQEHYNREWLIAIGAGIDSKNVRNVNEWLFDWLDSGWLAEAAMQGYLDAPSMGVYNIEDIVLKHKKKEIDNVHLL